VRLGALVPFVFASALLAGCGSNPLSVPCGQPSPGSAQCGAPIASPTFNPFPSQSAYPAPSNDPYYSPQPSYRPTLTYAPVPTAAPDNSSALVGNWLGPMPGDTGACGSAYAAYTIGGGGTYSVQANSAGCGGFTTYGSYSTQGSEIVFHQQGNDCGECQQVQDLPATFAFTGGANNLQLCDYPSGGQCHIYHRQ
jgi:hypothetical protein